MVISTVTYYGSLVGLSATVQRPHLLSEKLQGKRCLGHIRNSSLRMKGGARSDWVPPGTLNS